MLQEESKAGCWQLLLLSSCCLSVRITAATAV
jgi:hypothetical protein